MHSSDEIQGSRSSVGAAFSPNLEAPKHSDFADLEMRPRPLENPELHAEV